MPKKTFYNLPEEKRKKILDAACSEFLRVPYEEVSINQIIKIAQIPRGSFYQYFDDKDDLFDYFIHIYKEKLDTTWKYRSVINAKWNIHKSIWSNQNSQLIHFG